jgi:hypothetical protein
VIFVFNKNFFLIFLVVLVCGHYANGSGMFNWLRPYDTLITPEHIYNCGLQLTLFAEGGLRNAQGFNECGEPVNVLQIWDERQNAIAMLEGFPPESPISQKLAQLDITSDNGMRGYVKFNGELRLEGAFAVAAHYYFWEHLAVAVYFPFYSMSLSMYPHPLAQDDTSPEAQRIREYLTNNFDQNVFMLGNGLNLTGWKKSGPGDLVILAEWLKDFPQQMRPMLKNVRMVGRFGFNMPTGVRQDENQPFFPPFGYDGTVGVIAGGGLSITLACYMRLGFDVELVYQFSNTRERRIKTYPDQTELLLLQKVCAYRDFGLNQRFNIFAEFYSDYIKELSLKIGYQFFKHNADTLAFSSCDFSASIANTAKSLDESTMQHVMINARYDLARHWPYDPRYKPYFSLYARLPFKGTNIALIPVLGAVVSVNF